MGYDAIETEYRGCHFRSRQEARWAVCFDALGIRWQYENEGFRFDNGMCYLPDFLLPELRLWVEVKGRAPTDDEFIKATLLAQSDPAFSVVLTWQDFTKSRAGDNVMFWTDSDGVFHSKQRCAWLMGPEPGWAAARAARFDRPRGLFRQWEPRAGYGELVY